MSDDSGSWDPDGPWWRKRRLVALLGAVALLVVGGVVWQTSLRPDNACAAGVRKVGGECVGVTDGSYSFSDDLADVSGLVRKENKQVGDKDFVGVVYLMPLAMSPGSTLTEDSVRHEVEGAYLAQYEANERNSYGDFPKIRLLLANSGTTPEQHSAALDEIKGRIARDHIVAVAGLGTSTAETAAMIRRVTADPAHGGLQLGAVAAVMTADTLESIDGLVRTAPTNSEEARAAAAFLKSPGYLGKKVMVFADRRPGDEYTDTLKKAFLAALPANRRVGQVETYDSSQRGVATAFATRMPTLCANRADVVFFAGRGIDLARFLAPLRSRTCAKDRQVTVISGDDASQASQAHGFDEIRATLAKGNVRLVYTGLAHPGEWKKDPAAFPQAAVDVFQGRGNPFQRFFRQEALDDGQAIMGFDAVLTTVRGARLAQQNGRITGSDMIQIWKSLHSVEAVSGASGFVSFDEYGSPEQKAVPIVEINATGPDSTTLAVTSTTGSPYVPPKAG